MYIGFTWDYNVMSIYYNTRLTFNLNIIIIFYRILFDTWCIFHSLISAYSSFSFMLKVFWQFWQLHWLLHPMPPLKQGQYFFRQLFFEQLQQMPVESMRPFRISLYSFLFRSVFSNPSASSWLVHPWQVQLNGSQLCPLKKHLQ